MVMDGYIRRIWMNKGIDKVAMLKKGVFIVRFRSIEKCEEVLAGHYNFFDSKPLIVKAWDPDMDPMKE